MSICPACNMNLRGNEDCPRCTKGTGLTGAQHRRAEFDSLAPCYRCGGAGILSGPIAQVDQNAGMARLGRKQITNGETQGITSCPCARGQWMRHHGEVFRAPVERPVSTTVVLA